MAVGSDEILETVTLEGRIVEVFPASGRGVCNHPRIRVEGAFPVEYFIIPRNSLDSSWESVMSGHRISAAVEMVDTRDLGMGRVYRTNVRDLREAEFVRSVSVMFGGEEILTETYRT